MLKLCAIISGSRPSSFPITPDKFSLARTGGLGHNFNLSHESFLHTGNLPGFALLLGLGCSLQAKATDTIGLFNGQNLDGWVIENNGQFSVADGVIKLDKEVGWLRSSQNFADFTLIVEFRFLEKGANSGIFVRTGPTSKEDENGWPDNGYQVQCMDTLEGQYPLAHMIPYGAPEFESESDIETLKRVYRPAGKWQTYEITCRGETMEIRLNGALITTCRSIKNLTGHIGIQGEHGLLEFRKIEVIKL